MNDMNKAFLPLILVALGGCTVKGEYSCGVPGNGVRCQPMTATHEQLNDGTLVSLHTDPFADDSIDADNDGDYAMAFNPHDTSAASEAADPGAAPSILSIRPKQAVLSAPREMRIWFNRFTDPDGDLHDESYVFVRIDNGHWTIDGKPVLY
jgi:conjugal transfer pilus assembly protein TraV